MIVATAGHVDHGKTALIKALTGVDSDRLPEEKRRGMTIDLGFAYMALRTAASSEPIAFVDVPGHQRFIRNMLCGVGGTDYALLVIAADDGPMPQTREHLAIVDLLGIAVGAVALTKVDRVPRERVAEVASEISAMLAGTTLAQAPVFPVSAISGEGMAELKRHIEQVAAGFPARAASGNFRLPIDRCFTLAGAGLIVTGTAAAGSLATGESVRLLAADVSLRARSIHAQNRETQRCSAGQRCAINLKGAGLTADSVARGEWLVSGSAPSAQGKIDVRLRILGSEPRAFAQWTPVHVHLGAENVTGRVALLDSKSLEPGCSALARLVLDRPIGALHADRFIVRDQSAQRTIGGGQVIDVFPPARGRAKPERLAELVALEEPDPARALLALLEQATGGVDLQRFQQNRNLTDGESATLFARVAMLRVGGAFGLRGFSPRRWDELRCAVLGELGAYHAQVPGGAGASLDRIFGKTQYRWPRALKEAIARELARAGAIARSGKGYCLPTHVPKLSPSDESLWRRVEELLDKYASRPPSLAEIADALAEAVPKVDAMLGQAVGCNLALRIAPNRYFLPGTVLALAETLHALTLEQGRAVTAAQFRDRSGLGRGLSIEVLEYFDRVKFTRRVGAGRLLNCAPRDLFGS